MIELAGVVDGGARPIFVGIRRAAGRTLLAGALHGALPEQASAACWLVAQKQGPRGARCIALGCIRPKPLQL